MRPLMIECLERRLFLSASLSDNGLLVVRGTAGNDAIEMLVQLDMVQVRIGTPFGERHDFPVDGVKRIRVLGLAGDDSLLVLGDVFSYGISSPATVKGGKGDDLITGGDAGDLLYGGSSNDSLTGNDGNDTMYGGPGDDAVWGSGGNDRLFGMTGYDQVGGDAGNDRVNGGAGNDILDVAKYFGRDTITTGSGKDFLYAEDRDTITDATSADRITLV